MILHFTTKLKESLPRADPPPYLPTHPPTHPPIAPLSRTFSAAHDAHIHALAPGTQRASGMEATTDVCTRGHDSKPYSSHPSSN